MASTSSVPKSFKYDVFLSFRGEDTRKTFVDHLYHALVNKGIITYKDDEKIEKGERINEQLMRSIEDSRFYIIVFSKNYAASSWCLDELAKIMECQKMTEHTAYPIFYDVEPTEIRNQSGSVWEAFEQSTRKRKRTLEDVAPEKEDDVGRWRVALKEAAGLAGWELKNTLDGHEAKFIQTIVKHVSLNPHFINSSVDGKLVGMGTRVNNMVSSLEINSDDVRMIGIWGMGGGGKTTLARAVFDHISIWFDAKCFVENVREGSKGSGLKVLQKKVLQCVLNDKSIKVESVYDGKRLMERMMCSKRVLVVLDDVDDTEQLEALAGDHSWFKPGSRIIITTRDKQVLVAHGVHNHNIHDVSLLSHEEAICLFSRYAFNGEIPNQGYEDLSGKVVHYAAGLPLTIKVLGAHLCGRSECEWVDAIERLKTFPLEKTLKRLELSYNGLENDQKEIFLDIACILKGEKKKKAIKILQSCGFHAQIGLRVLEQKSLITISKEDYNDYGFDDSDDDDVWDDVEGRMHPGEGGNSEKLFMHDHLEELGRNIVRRLHREEPKRHGRLWIREEIEDILVNELGNEETKCLKLRCTDLEPAIIMKGLRMMKELRLLYVECLYSIDVVDEVDEVFKYLPDALQSLYWYPYPFSCLPETFRANKLVNLEMPDSNIYELWEGGERKVLKNLKFLDLSGSKLRTFDLMLTPLLEELNLKGCDQLFKLHMPDKCPNLKFLNLSYTKVSNINLRMTPHLGNLALRGCADFIELHMPVECPNLKILILHVTKVGNLNLGMTPNLEKLYLVACNEFELDMSVKCPKLIYLKIRGSKVSNINLELTPNLKKLDLSKCHSLLKIHAPVGCLNKLVYFHLGTHSNFESFKVYDKHYNSANHYSVATSVIEARCIRICPLHLNNKLPKIGFKCETDEPGSSWMGNLEKLVYSSLCPCKYLEYWPATISGSQHLRGLKLKGSIPVDLCQLESLETLSLSEVEIRHLPESICMLKHLKKLQISNCWVIEQLPEDICGLECLEKLDIWYCTSLRDIPNSICKMKCLKYLSLCGCEKVETLPENFGCLECLEKLHLAKCTSLRDIPNSTCKMKCLKGLDLSYCDQVKKLPEELGSLECLKELYIEGSGISRLPQCIYQLKGLRIIGSREQLESCGFTSLRNTSDCRDYDYCCYYCFYVELKALEPLSKLNQL
ncbi:disease resistance protein RPV1 [Helianthus annuus]|uniref:disease resistance protein RPV1 n=1 Tax=Helianthus annuus TaxID=4232 RepID=UPI001652BEC3|nr:disease resistance protein RPV1 [Helianthus annuus]